MEVQAIVRTLPLQRLRIAVRQVEALAAEG
jgi:hypothetical protein